MPQVLMHISNFSREREVSQQSELATLKVIIRDFMKAMELAWVTTVETYKYMFLWDIKDPVLCVSFTHIPLCFSSDWLTL